MSKKNPEASFQSALRSAAAALEQGRLDDAARQYLALTQRVPDAYAAHSGLALAFERQGRANDAIAVLNAATQQFPEEPESYLRLGNLLAGADHWELAERYYAAACSLHAGNAVAQHNWGVALHELGRSQEAIPAFERALGLKPDYATAYCSLGLAYQAIDAPDAALVAFDCAVQIDGRESRFALEHARTRVKLGQWTEALAELEALSARRPNDPVVFNLQGLAFKKLRRADDARAAFDRATALDPAYAEAFNNRANLHLQARRFSLALRDCDAALALKPDLDWLRGTRLYAAAHSFEWTGYPAELEAIVHGVRRGAKVIQPLALQTLVDDPALQQQAARLWTLNACAPVLPAATAAHARTSGKIRVAYVSKDFGSNPVSYLIAEVIELHDRERFEIIAINYGPASSDAVQARLRAGFDSFLDVERLPDAAVAQLAQRLAVDIAVDLSGFTDEARSSIFAWRAAPVQVAYLGYLGTSGTRLYDYLIADAHTVPAASRPCYDERLVQLPSYQANDRRRPQPPAARRSAAGLPETGVVYCCFNNPCKITPAQFSRWMQILAAVPGSVLWLLDEDGLAPVHLRQHAASHGIEGHRIVFAQRTDREGYLANLGAADLFLDTLPYNAGTTASDALWVGLPVLTQAGRAFAGRMAASLLHAVGLPELIAEDADSYVALAVQLGRQPAALADLKARLRQQRETCPLFDSVRFTRSLESAYEAMQEISEAGQAPRDIVVQSSR